MGDSHVGRSRHPKTGEGIDCVGQFLTAIEVAIEADVDAVVHTGDVFHDTVTTGEANRIDAAFDALSSRELPFYYVLGNHECAVRNDLLNRWEESGTVHHLSAKGVVVSNDLILHGIDDHAPKSFPSRTLRGQNTTDGKWHVLVLHQSLTSVRGGQGLDLPLAYLEQYDCVVSGHLHDSEQYEWDNGRVLYAGSTEWLSKKKSPKPPSVWFLDTSKGEGIGINGHPIR